MTSESTGVRLVDGAMLVVNERETRRRTPGVPLYFSLPHTISDALTSGHGLVQQAPILPALTTSSSSCSIRMG